MGISGSEIFLILIFILVFFGAGKIPDFARALGKGVREFKKATEEIKAEINNSTGDIKKEMDVIRDDVKKDMPQDNFLG